MNSLSDLAEEINKIKERNINVEADKAWETFLTRKILIAVLTYIVISLFFYYAGFPNPLKSAFVPTLGFIFSTLSVPFFKNLWIKYIYRRS